MNRSIIALSLLLSVPAYADQCAYNSEADAQKAVEVLKPGSKVMYFCEPCSNQEKQFEIVNSAAKEQVEDMQQYWMVKINQGYHDLAYTFVRTAEKAKGAPADVYTNVSKLVGCPSSDVSETLEEK